MERTGTSRSCPRHPVGGVEVSRSELVGEKDLTPDPPPPVLQWRYGAARVTTRSHPVLQVGDAGSVDGSYLLELRLGVPQVVEEALTVAEQHRYHVELELVQQPCRHVLLNGPGAAPEPHVPAVRGLPRPLE